MDTRDHLVAVVDDYDAAESTLAFARKTVEQGGRATVVFGLGNTDRGHIQAYAESEHLSIGVAENLYIQATASALNEAIGGSETQTIVAGVRDGRAVIEAAVRSNATSVAVPAPLARTRQWRRAMAKAPVPVIVTPTRAA